jgi:hypothetical protein
VGGEIAGWEGKLSHAPIKRGGAQPPCRRTEKAGHPLGLLRAIAEEGSVTELVLEVDRVGIAVVGDESQFFGELFVLL